MRNISGLIAATIALASPPLLAQVITEPDGTTRELEEDEVLLSRDQDTGEAPPSVIEEPRTLPDGETAPRIQTEPRAAPPSVLAILAHPDDEITIAPVLARVVREGGSVTLAFATSGDAGPGVSGMEAGAELATLRENEARCAAFALGLPEPLFWQLGDGTLSTMARAPDSTARQLKSQIGALIAELDPKIIMTWGPDGGYGHADHRMVSNAVTEVVQAMREGRPDLLYPALPASEDTPTEFAGWAKTHASLVTDRIRYEFADLEAMRIAVDCYQSQFDEQARAYLPDLLHRSVWQGQVHFRLAFPSAE